MRRAYRVLMLACLVAGLGLGFWLVRCASQSRSVSPQLARSVQSVLTNAVQSARNRFTGGVGVMLRPNNGPPVIQGIGVGSPAEAAGLHVGDVVLAVNGLATTNLSLAQVVEEFRGLTRGRVEVMVQRAGSTNVTCVIRRTSWNSLRGTTFNQTPGSNPPSPSTPAPTGARPMGPQPR